MTPNLLTAEQLAAIRLNHLKLGTLQCAHYDRGQLLAHVAAMKAAIKSLEKLRESAERLSKSSPPDAVHEGIYADLDEMAGDACPLAAAVLELLGRIGIEQPPSAR